MANISQTAANVKCTSATSLTRGTAGEAITQGQPLYTADSKLYQCDANGTAAQAACVGIAMTPAATDGVVYYAPTGATVNLGATLVVATTYAVSSTKGAICPLADLSTTGEYITTLGVASTASEIVLAINATGAQVPA